LPNDIWTIIQTDIKVQKSTLGKGDESEKKRYLQFCTK
jgi:hypothetical protein